MDRKKAAGHFQKVSSHLTEVQLGARTWPTFQLTLLQLVVHYHQKGHRDHEEVEDEADLAQLTDGRPAHLLHHRLVSALATDGRGVAQDDQTADQEHKGDLSGRSKAERWSYEAQMTQCEAGHSSLYAHRSFDLTASRFPFAF